MKRLLVAAFLGILALGTAEASIIPTFVSMVDLGGGIFAYTYDVSVESPGQRLQLSTSPGPTGIPAGGYDNHFTFFDFYGYVPGSASCTGASSFCDSFAVSVAGVGPTAYLQNPPDSASIPNITWTLMDDIVIAPGSYVGTFTLNSTSGNPTVIAFSGQGTLASTLFEGTVSGNSLNTIGPGVPEPATLVLLGCGLIGLGLSRKRLARR